MASRRKYRLTFDRAKAEEVLANEVAAGTISFPEASPESVEVEVWIDHRGRLRVYKPVAGAIGREYELWDFGKPDAVEIPEGLR